VVTVSSGKHEQLIKTKKLERGNTRYLLFFVASRASSSSHLDRGGFSEYPGQEILIGYENDRHRQKEYAEWFVALLTAATCGVLQSMLVDQAGDGGVEERQTVPPTRSFDGDRDNI
jgi:hypothetical protein